MYYGGCIHPARTPNQCDGQPDHPPGQPVINLSPSLFLSILKGASLASDPSLTPRDQVRGRYAAKTMDREDFGPFDLLKQRDTLPFLSLVSGQRQ